MFHVTQSQRIDLLLATLEDFFDQHPIGVFEPRQILVPSHGLGEWLRMRLADQQGICAQLDTDFMGSYQWKLYAKVLRNDVPDRSPLSRSVMQWRIFGYLTDMNENPDANGIEVKTLEVLLNKIKGGTAMQVRRQIWGLSGQIAQVFAAYVIYRPQWLQLWGNNQSIDMVGLLKKKFSSDDQAAPAWLLSSYAEMQPWQALLWRKLFAPAFEQREALMRQFWEILARDPARRREIPSTLTIFTVVQLPPAELAFLRQLAQYSHVHLLHYNPSQEYWADTVDSRWLARYQAKHPDRAALRDSQHQLLTRFGKQARDVFGLLSNLSGGEDGTWDDLFPAYYAPTLLGRLQHDILLLKDDPTDRIVFSPHDQSVVIHACHSSLRQLEVLREELLHWLALDAKRKPSDVLVLAPNLRDLAPLIRAVFPASSAQQQVHIPVDITGLASPDAEALWQSLTGRVALLDGRLDCETFLDWLSLLPVQRAYGLDRDAVQTASELLVAAGFRRGFDPVHLRQTLGERDHDVRFTLRFALDRLLLGMAMPAKAVHADVLAMPSVQREDFDLIAILARIFDDLDRYRAWLTEEGRSVSMWLDILRGQLTEAFPDEANNRGWDGVQKALDDMQQNLIASDRPDVPLPLRFVLDEVQSALETAPPGSVPSGRVTFARLGTLRPLPYRLIVMIGLESGQFPNRDPKNTFDLMAALPSELGDRSREEDELGAFLDGLLLAQEACWLFYNGFDVADVHPRQPAAPVQELIDFLNLRLIDDPATVSTNDSPADTSPIALRRLVRQHSLLPFEVDNFLPPVPDTQAMRQRQPRMMSGTWLDVAKTLHAPPASPKQAWAQHDAPRDAITTEGVHAWPRMINQLLDPARHFLQQIRVQNLHMEDALASFEPLTLNKLDQYQLRHGHQTSTVPLAPELLMDRLPVGAAQDAYFLQSERDAAQIERRVQQYAQPEGKLGIDRLTEHLLSVADWQLLIHVPQTPSTSLWLRCDPSSGRGKRQLQLWLEHLAWQVYRQTSAVDVQAQRGATVCVFSQQSLRFAPVEHTQATAWLLAWLAVWQQASVQPWVLPPDLVLDSTHGLKRSPKTAELTYKADKLLIAWQGEAYQTFNPRESRSCVLHPDWQLILQGQDSGTPFLHHLEQHALRLYAPLVEHLETCE